MPSTTPRHHPYAQSSAQGNNNSTASSSRQPIASGRNWTSGNGVATTSKAARTPEHEAHSPRSRRESSGTPSSGLGAAFGGRDGGKWWDEELPAPPASLSSILDSFRRSGEGDRDLLLAILGAKKAEEERLTALVQTRLTILQARLSVHAGSSSTSASLPSPTEADTVYSPRESYLEIPRESGSYMVERTPSLTSRASASSSTTGPVSPIEQPGQSLLYASYDDVRKGERRAGSFHLPPPTGLWRRHGETQREDLPSIKVPKGRAIKKSGSEELSPRSEHNGLEMLLDAGRRAEIN